MRNGKSARAFRGLNCSSSVGSLAFCRSNLLGRNFCLHEQQEIVAATRLGISARHVETAERVNSNQRSRALAVEVEITNMKLASRSFELIFIGAVNRSGQSVL